MGESEGSLRQNAASMNKNRIRGIQIEMRRSTLHRLGLAHGALLAAGAATAVEEAGAVGRNAVLRTRRSKSPDPSLLATGGQAHAP
jgi:hypothetical protein